MGQPCPAGIIRDRVRRPTPVRPVDRQARPHHRHADGAARSRALLHCLDRPLKAVTPDLSPTLLLTGALPSPDWLGQAGREVCVSSPGLRAMARQVRATQVSPAATEAIPEPGHERWLRQRFGLPDPYPFAACGPAAAGCSQADWRIDPVHLHLGRDHLVLTDPERLALTGAESSALRAAAAPLLAEEGLELIECSPALWALVHTDPNRPLDLRTHALTAALGRSIDAYLPQGPDARRWRRILNMVQMTWHIHPVNAQREAQGLPTVNGLWIEGPCPQADAGLSDARRQAAGALAKRIRHAPEGLRVDDGLSPLLVDDRFLQAQLTGDPQAFRSAWLKLDEQYFAAIARREEPWAHGATVVLSGDSGWRSLSITPARAWSLSALWRRTDCSGWLNPIDPKRPPA